MDKKFLIIGLGRFGTAMLKALHSLGHDVVVCDKNPLLLEHIQDYAEYMVEGDATDDELLEEMSVKEFDSVIVSVGENFEASVIIVAKLNKRDCKSVIVEAHDHLRGEILSEIVGASQVVYPEEEAALRFANQLTTPGIREYVELSPYCNGKEYNVNEDFIGKSLEELKLRTRFNVFVLLINRIHNKYPIISPSAQETFQSGDTFFVIGSPSDLNEFEHHFLD